jgi:2-dehydro-3-deoxyphosphogluconate aldolase/(4S)-4-hydroxy-2-oxoglutarate aldolase
MSTCAAVLQFCGVAVKKITAAHPHRSTAVLGNKEDPMEKREVFNRMISEALIPVIRVSSAKEAIDVADALKEGGVSFLEITMTVQGAIDVIKELAQKYKDEIVMGAGTILDSETGRAALLAGAQFIVSPTLNLDLIQLAHRYSAVVIPGAMTPTEILTAWNAGADMVKVFPAAQLGGPEYLKAIRGPLPQILLVPTGGVNLQNAGAFIKAGATALGVGGELVDKKAIKDKKFNIITENARAYLKVIKEARQG